MKKFMEKMGVLDPKKELKRMFSSILVGAAALLVFGFILNLASDTFTMDLEFVLVSMLYVILVCTGLTMIRWSKVKKFLSKTPVVVVCFIIAAVSFYFMLKEYHFLVEALIMVSFFVSFFAALNSLLRKF